MQKISFWSYKTVMFETLTTSKTVQNLLKRYSLKQTSLEYYYNLFKNVPNFVLRLYFR